MEKRAKRIAIKESKSNENKSYKKKNRIKGDYKKSKHKFDYTKEIQCSLLVSLKGWSSYQSFFFVYLSYTLFTNNRYINMKLRQVFVNSFNSIKNRNYAKFNIRFVRIQSH